MSRFYIELHALQTVPSSNINRDDSGSPKTAFYGGVQRARVSSQAWKRSIRTAMADSIDPARLSMRTARVVQVVRDQVLELAPNTDAKAAASMAEEVLKAAGLKVKAPKRASATLPENGYLLFLSRAQARRLAEIALAGDLATKEAKDAAKAALATDQGVDIALFGRMVADDKSLSVEASCQVAHAISVDAVTPEFDYYTAVDDLSEDNESGAGMIGTIEFNSSTLYRYANLNVEALEATLGDRSVTARATGAFIEAFVRSMPTGKQNSFANRTLPDAVVVMIRETQPINLVQAFERPVRAQEGKGVVEAACAALAVEAGETARSYGEQPVRTFVVRKGERTAALSELGEDTDLETLVTTVEGLVSTMLGKSTDE